MRKISSHLLALFVIFTFFCLFFFGNPFNYGNEGDDLLITNPYVQDVFITNSKNYVSMAQGRSYLLLSMIYLYKHFGPQLSLVIYLIIWLTNGYLIFVWLNKKFSYWSSILAALFFVGYSSKYEIFVVLSGGMYHTVLMIMLVMLLVLFSNRQFHTKVAIFTILFWLSLHVYEILAPAAFIPIIYLLSSKCSLSQERRKYLLSCLPVCILALHAAILSHVSNPIWNRSESLSLWRVLQSIPKVEWMSINELYGPRHLKMLFLNYEYALDAFNLNSKFSVNTTVYAVCITIVALICSFLYFKNKPSIKHNCGEYKQYFYISVFLIFICPLVAIPVALNGDTLPPRFTYLPSVGLAVIFAALIQWNKRNIVNYALFSWLLFELVSTRSILLQYAISADIDTSIRNGFKDLNNQIQKNDSIALFIDGTKSDFNSLKYAPSKFQNNAAIPLFLIDNPDLVVNDDGSIGYENIKYKVYFGQLDDGVRFNSYNTEFSIKKVEEHNKYFLYSNNKLSAIGQIDFVNYDSVVKSIKLNDKNRDVLQISAIEFNFDNMIDCERNFVVHVPTEKKFDLQFKIKKFPGDQDFYFILKGKNKILLKELVVGAGSYVLRYSVDPSLATDESLQFTFGVQGVQTDARALYKVEEIRIVR